MYTFRALGIGYLFGCISPAAILGKIKHIDLRKAGTGNLGATNTSYVLGGKAGFFVLITDVLKSILSALVSLWLCPGYLYAKMVAGIGCILGHCYPANMKFRGGKGVAAFAGMVLTYNAWFAIPIIVLGTALILLLNTGVAAPMLGAVLFPILVALRSSDRIEVMLALIAGVVLVFTHRDNLKLAFSKQDVISVQNYLERFKDK